MTASEIVSHEGYFKKETFQNYLRGFMEYKNGNYLSSVLEAAVFLEALLKDILKESTSPKSNVTLGGLVSSLRKYTDDADKTDKENILKDILDVIYRNIRNNDSFVGISLLCLGKLCDIGKHSKNKTFALFADLKSLNLI